MGIQKEEIHVTGRTGRLNGSRGHVPSPKVLTSHHGQSDVVRHDRATMFNIFIDLVLRNRGKNEERTRRKRGEKEEGSEAKMRERVHVAKVVAGRSPEGCTRHPGTGCP